MSNSERLGLPIFFNYKEEGTDNGYETIQDFYLSWALRWADEKYSILNPRIHEFGRQTVFFLIYGENKDDEGFCLYKKIDADFRITNVKTRRQYKKIDLIAEIEIVENSIKKKHIFNIENKWYSSIRNGQLEYSRSVIQNKNGITDFEIMNFVIFCDREVIQKDPSQIQKCIANNYKCLTIGDIKEYTQLKAIGKTGNALFDEYWFNL